MTRHNKKQNSGMTHYRRKKKGIGCGNGAHVRRRRKSWCERQGKKIPRPVSRKTPCTEGVA